MKDPKETKPEEPHPDKYARFIKLLTDIVAVPKAAIYELDPKVRPKPSKKPAITRHTSEEPEKARQEPE